MASELAPLELGHIFRASDQKSDFPQLSRLAAFDPVSRKSLGNRDEIVRSDYEPRACGSPWRMRAEKSGESPAAFAFSVMLLLARRSTKGISVTI